MEIDVDSCQALPTLHFVPTQWTEEFPWLTDLPGIAGADDIVWDTLASLSNSDKQAAATHTLVCGGGSLIPGYVPTLHSFLNAKQQRAIDADEADAFGGLVPSYIAPGAVKGSKKWKAVYQQSASSGVVLQAIESAINSQNTWRVVASEDWVSRQFASYIGGSLLGCLGVFGRQMAVPISTYFEMGAEALCARFF